MRTTARLGTPLGEVHVVAILQLQCAIAHPTESQRRSPTGKSCRKGNSVSLLSSTITLDRGHRGRVLGVSDEIHVAGHCERLSNTTRSEEEELQVS